MFVHLLLSRYATLLFYTWKIASFIVETAAEQDSQNFKKEASRSSKTIFQSTVRHKETTWTFISTPVANKNHEQLLPDLFTFKEAGNSSDCIL